MRLVKPSIEFMDMNSLGLKLIEKAGRTCYKSEDKISEGTDEVFVKKLMNRGHDAMLEFGWMCYKFICNRGVTHEIVRHRLFSYAQESTRYCNYKGGVEFIIPHWAINMVEGKFDKGTLRLYTEQEHVWLEHKLMCEETYQKMIELGQTPQDARDNLPIATKTEIVVAGNFREWRHFYSQRLPGAAHPQMREVAELSVDDARKRVPVLFDEF